jgi:hypothetical protein
MSSLPSEDPERARLLAQRYSERQRLGVLKVRLDQTDAEQHPRAFDTMQEAMRKAADRLAEIEGELAGAEIARPVCRRCA